MRRIGRYKNICAMSAVALGLLAVPAIEDAAAYFTTYVSAGGSQVVNLEAKTEIREDVSEMTKHVTIRNTSSKGDCFVRVKVFHGDDISVDYANVPEVINGEKNENWYDGGNGYWYYKPALPTGKETTMLDVSIDTSRLVKPGTEADAVPEYIKDQFNVIVIQECTPVIYGENGEEYADWNTVYSDYAEASGSQGEEADD